MPTLIAACGTCRDVRLVAHRPDFCPGCRSIFDRRPLALIRVSVVVEGTTVRVRPIAEFVGEWSAEDVAAIRSAIGAEGVQAVNLRDAGQR